MKNHLSVLTLGTRDLARARRFYGDGLGWPILQDYPGWLCFALGDGRSGLGLLPWEALAADAGLPPEGEGFRGVTLSCVVGSAARVAEVLAEAERAGATIVRPAAAAAWGGTSGSFADPDGHVWKVAAGNGGDPFVAE